MSVPSRRFTLTRKAQTDFAGIMAYTVEHWGAHQRDIYAEKLLAGFDTIVRFPDIGKDRSDISPGVFSHPIEQHVVYYRFTATRVRVLRLRHVRADAGCTRLPYSPLACRGPLAPGRVCRYGSTPGIEPWDDGSDPYRERQGYTRPRVSDPTGGRDVGSDDRLGFFG